MGMIRKFRCKRRFFKAVFGVNLRPVQLPQSEMHDLIIELRSMTLGVGSFQWKFDHLHELSGKEADDVVSQRKAALAEG